MAEHIDRDKTIAEIDDYFPANPTSEFSKGVAVGLAMAKVAVNHTPAADVRPVVLCKDCVYSDKWYADRLICYLWNEHDGNSVFEDGFCNYGAKREES